MRRIICIIQLVVATCGYPLYNPYEHLYPLALPYTSYSVLNYGQNYAPQSPIYSSHVPTYTEEYIADPVLEHSSFPDIEPTLNVLVPYAMSNEFSVVPMFVVSKNSMKMVSQGDIVSVSNQQPVITVKMNESTSIPCTPAVRMVFEKPIIVGSLKSNILFPSEVEIIYHGVRVPIRIGAVLAPVLPTTYLSLETPIAVRVVYAVPTKPIKITITIQPDYDVSQEENQKTSQSFDQTNQEQQGTTSDNNQQNLQDFVGNDTDTSSGSSANEGLNSSTDYINNSDAVFVSNQEAIIVESESELPPKNITIISFPNQEAEPELQVDEEDEELVNRNPPLVLAPAGIVQSTQPEAHVEAFHNDKESPYLETLREKSKRKRI